jgi:NADH-quinone oxidoreductase subunit A
VNDVERGTMSESYIPILLLFLIVGGMAALILYLSGVLGPHDLTEEKVQPFESGIPAVSPHQGSLSVRFYIIAMIFILFDIELVFLYPWAILFRTLGLFGFVEIIIFLGILALGLAYAWRKGGLEWE